MQEQSLFIEALEMEDGAARAAFLDRVCADDAVLRRRIERLLRRHQDGDSFLELFGASLSVTVDDPIRERPGTVLGPYKLLEQIGEGGFGVVFLAEQTQPIRRRVALKVLKPGMDTRQVVARFETERQALALMDHPNIAHVFDGGQTAAGRPYFVMELVKGAPITDFCDHNQVSIRERLELFLSVCQAVRHAHQKGIIHRDLKPSNVLVTMHDTTPVVKVIDFGIAKAMGQELTDKTLFTGFAQMIGTPLYMSPEQAGQSGLDVDTRTDIYALGVLLYELLTGTTPLDKERLRAVGYDEIRHIIREEEPPKPSTRISTLGLAAATVSTRRQSDPRRLNQLFRGELDWIVMKALEKDRNRRYESASAFAADVRHYLHDEPVQACPPSVWYRFRKFARRNKRALAAVSVLALAAFLVMGVVAGSLGWMARDRSVRQTKLNLEVEHAVDEAEKACDQALTLTDNPYQWEAVLAAAASALKRADGLAAQEEGGLEPAVHERLEALRARLDADERDRRFIARSDKLRYEALSQAKLEIVFPTFKEAFQSHYAITFGATPPEKILNFLEQRPRPIRHYLVAALDSSLAFVPKEDPQAREWLTAVLRAVDSSDPWRKQARAAMEARDWQALSKLLEGPAASRQSPIVLLGLAARYQWEGPTAVDFWRHLRQSYPGDFWANQSLALMLHYHQGRLEEAIRYYTASIALRPRSPACYVNLGNALWGNGELDEALAAYRQAVAIAPRYAAAHEQLGLALERKGWPDAAIAELRQALRFRNDARGHLLLGNILARNGLPDEAIASYRKAIALDPKLGLAHYNLSAALLDKNECLDEAITSYRNAIACYREAIALNRGDGVSHHELAWILVMCANVQLRDSAEGVKLARKAVELLPSDGSSWKTLGAAQYRAGDWKEAVAALAQSMQLRNGGDSYDWFFLAMAHWQLGEKERARQWFDRAVQWMEKNLPNGRELGRLRAEAAELLKIEQKKK